MQFSPFQLAQRRLPRLTIDRFIQIYHNSTKENTLLFLDRCERALSDRSVRLVNTSNNVFSVDISQRLKRIAECKLDYTRRLKEMSFSEKQINAVLDAYQRELPSFSDVLNLVMQQPQI